jgi:two-component system cell cycle response regulator DivK
LTVAKILIVEDNADNMKLFRAVLAIRQHAVTSLYGGEGLLEAVRSTQPDVILLDIQLPGTDGFQLMDLLRKDGMALPAIVALTAHAMSGDREKAMAAGFDGYLTKPIDVASFGQSVEGFIRS